MRLITFFFVMFLSFSSYSSELVDLDFKNLSPLHSFQLLSDYNNSNVVVSPSFDNDLRLTVKLSVPWSVAFERLLVAFDADYLLVDGVYFIYPAVSDDSLPVYSPVVFDLNFVSPSTVFELFPVLDFEYLLYSDGVSSIVAFMPKERLSDLSNLITVVDVPKKQVMLDFKVFEVFSDSSDFEGLNFNSIADDSVFNLMTSVGSLPVSASLTYDAYNLLISELSSSGSGKVLSNPRVFVFSGKTASISSGSDVPYTVSQGDGQYITNFKSASLALTVSPVVYSDSIFIDLEFIKNEPDFSRSDIPVILTNSFTSSFKLDSTNTLALGGITLSRSSERVSKGFFSKIPLIGRFFTNSSKVVSDSDLLLFVTATIVD